MRVLIAKLWKWYLLRRIPKELRDLSSTTEYVEEAEHQEGYRYWLQFTPKTLVSNLKLWHKLVQDINKETTK